MIPKRFIDYYGDQFRWFIGKVVDLNDPQQLGRIKVNAYGIHDEISNSDLPWASVIAPVVTGGNDSFTSSLGIQIDAQVFGIFLDGQNSQLPLIVGSIPKDGDINPLTTGTQTKTYTLDEKACDPADPYAAEYPHNKVYETTQGHVKEYDDTPGATRIREIHGPSGTFYQMHHDGSYTLHVNNNKHVRIDGNECLHITGDWNVTVDGNINIDCSDTTFTGNVNILGNLNVSGSIRGESGVSVAQDFVTDRGISLNNHRHRDTKGLGANPTEPPIS